MALRCRVMGLTDCMISLNGWAWPFVLPIMLLNVPESHTAAAAVADPYWTNRATLYSTTLPAVQHALGLRSGTLA